MAYKVLKNISQAHILNNYKHISYIKSYADINNKIWHLWGNCISIHNAIENTLNYERWGVNFLEHKIDLGSRPGNILVFFAFDTEDLGKKNNPQTNLS